MRELAFGFASSYAGVGALLFFFVFFVVLAIWTFRPGAKAEHQRNASIPLKD